MKKGIGKFLFFGYAVAVLGFSAFARAESRIALYTQNDLKVPLAIEAVGLDGKTYDLHVDGYAPNSCFGEPQATLREDGSQSNVLILEFVASPSTGICNARITPFFKIINLADLASSSSLDLIPGETYIIKARDIAIELQIPLTQIL